MSEQLDFRKFRERVGDVRPKEYWRSLEELSRGDDFDEVLRREFPQQALPLDKGVDRRDFVKLMGASVAMAGLAACRQPAEAIVPYVKQPESLIPGKPLFFASVMPLLGIGTGVLVESHMGRPTKIEGNPDHPSSLGASDAYMQASTLNLWDPDRSQVVRKLGEISTWSEFIAALQPVMTEAKKNGAGVRLLTQTITSPTLGSNIQALLAAYPGMQWHQWDPAGRDNVREGTKAAFGGDVNVTYDFTKANVVVSLGSDFLDDGPGHLRYTRDFMSRRRVRKGTANQMNRLYTIESSPTGTGSIADHRLPARPSQIEGYARAIAAELNVGPALSRPGPTESRSYVWIAALARDLQKNRGACVVIPGDDQPPAVHQIAHAINQALGNIGTTVLVTDSLEVAPVNQLESLRKLVTDMNAGAVRALVMLGGNPVFDAPADFNFSAALAKVPFRAHLASHYDETSMLVHWHIPETHFLEAWGDVRGHDGTVSIQQPLIAPLYNGRAAIEVIGALNGGMELLPYDAVRKYWTAKGATETEWKKWLNDGVIAGSALPPKTVAAGSQPAGPAESRPPQAGIELHLRRDPNILDGRFANNGWLRELPQPQTKIAWENALLVSPATAGALGIDPGEDNVNEKRTFIVKLTYRGKTLEAPVWVVPGQADNVVTIAFGHGRDRGGTVATKTWEDAKIGVNTYPIRFSDALSGGAGVQIAKTARLTRIACTQEHQRLDMPEVGNRGIIRSASLEEYRREPNFARHQAASEEESENVSMWPEVEYKDHKWAMSIDTSVCTGCNGCVIACQAENNIAIVGKEEVVREREMHWLRIDRYYKGSAENPEVYHQPVPCMQCENAPCEPVCPVGATSHSGDGLNDMTYNRCVGTRYCSNNCPYKVRRFNFFHYSDYDTPALRGMRNPNVTVRTRGVMEKCTYCVQRVNAAKIEAEKDNNRKIRDGEFTTACAQACPSQAIVFGDLNDPDSEVRKLKLEPTNYALLEELNTRPRTTYLANVRNPNPEIKA